MDEPPPLDGSELLEMLTEAGIGIDIASTVAGTCTGMLGARTEAAMTFDEVDPGDYVGIVVVGGAVKNRFWMQNKADMAGGLFGCSLEVPQVEEATPLGAAMLAGIGAGLYRDEEDACNQVHKPGMVYTPEPEAARTYAEMFAIYRQLYPALRPVSHGLSASQVS